MTAHFMQNAIEKARQIKLVIFDVDGVLTDGTLFLGDDGQEYKAFNAKDGHGMVMLRQSGTQIGIITARTSNLVAKRMAGLGIEHVYQGQKNKVVAFETLLEKCQLETSQVAFVGDDVVDLPVMGKVGLAVAVADAQPIVKEYADWITPRNGGRGAARDICEFIMRANGTWEATLAPFLPK